MLCSVLSGVIFFAEYAEGWSSVWVYSIVYNGSYMIPEIIITSLAALLLYRPLERYFLGKDLQK